MDALFGSKPAEGGVQKEHSKSSNSELFSSAKQVAEAAQSTFSNQSDKVDKTKVAGAADNLLNSAREYGKLDEKGYGTYVDKADQYLHKYSSTTTAPPAAAPAPHDSGEEKPAGIGGVGDVTKTAGGFFK